MSCSMKSQVLHTVCLYNFWWGSRRNLKLITLGSERVKVGYYGHEFWSIGRAGVAAWCSLPRVINVKFPLQPHQKHYITQYEELGFISYILRFTHGNTDVKTSFEDLISQSSSRTAFFHSWKSRFVQLEDTCESEPRDTFCRGFKISCCHGSKFPAFEKFSEWIYRRSKK